MNIVFIKSKNKHRKEKMKKSVKEKMKKALAPANGKKETAEREGNRSGRLIAKIMLNAVYGKFAQRPDRYREFLFVPLDNFSNT